MVTEKKKKRKMNNPSHFSILTMRIIANLFPTPAPELLAGNGLSCLKFRLDTL
jgi:hypothetical protein